MSGRKQSACKHFNSQILATVLSRGTDPQFVQHSPFPFLQNKNFTVSFHLLFRQFLQAQFQNNTPQRAQSITAGLPHVLKELSFLFQLTEESSDSKNCAEGQDSLQHITGDPQAQMFFLLPQKEHFLQFTSFWYRVSAEILEHF